MDVSANFLNMLLPFPGFLLDNSRNSPPTKLKTREREPRKKPHADTLNRVHGDKIGFSLLDAASHVGQKGRTPSNRTAAIMEWGFRPVNGFSVHNRKKHSPGGVGLEEACLEDCFYGDERVLVGDRREWFGMNDWAVGWCE